MAFQVAKHNGGEGQSMCGEQRAFSGLKWRGNGSAGIQGFLCLHSSITHLKTFCSSSSAPPPFKSQPVQMGATTQSPGCLRTAVSLVDSVGGSF